MRTLPHQTYGILKRNEIERKGSPHNFKLHGKYHLKIPPNLPLPKGGEVAPPFRKGGRGGIFIVAGDEPVM
jgi:hypothetical protein